MPRCDLIIPVFNNSRVLPIVLAALGEQMVPAGWTMRVLISDDGSSDATIVIARQWIGKISWPIVIIPGPHTGPAGARNRALDQTQADIIFFLGADIVLRPGAIATHLFFHEHHPAVTDAALGVLKWDPRLAPTPIMEWMIHGGPQNDYDALLGRNIVAGKYFYASHVSVKLSLIGRQRFSLAYQHYGWEDQDFGRRLGTRGLQLHLLPQALGLHRHFYAVADIIRRQYAVGCGRRTLDPAYQKFHWQYWLFAKIGGGLFLHVVLYLTASQISTPWLFSIFTGSYYWQGVHDSAVDNN